MNMDPGTERSLRDMPAQIARLNRSVNELTDCVKSMRDALLLIAVAQDVRCDIDLIRIKDDFPKCATDPNITLKENFKYELYEDMACDYSDRQHEK